MSEDTSDAPSDCNILENPIAWAHGEAERTFLAKHLEGLPDKMREAFKAIFYAGAYSAYAATVASKGLALAAIGKELRAYQEAKADEKSSAVH
jgi:hypothetical protein